MIFAFFASCVFQPAFSAIRGLDFVEHPHRFFVRAAMQRALQRSASRRHRGVNIRQGRCRHARGKGRCIEFMVRVQNENRVHHPDLPILRHVPGQLVEEIAGMSQIRLIRNRILAL